MNGVKLSDMQTAGRAYCVQYRAFVEHPWRDLSIWLSHYNQVLDALEDNMGKVPQEGEWRIMKKTVAHAEPVEIARFGKPLRIIPWWLLVLGWMFWVSAIFGGLYYFFGR